MTKLATTLYPDIKCPICSQVNLKLTLDGNDSVAVFCHY